MYRSACKGAALSEPCLELLQVITQSCFLITSSNEYHTDGDNQDQFAVLMCPSSFVLLAAI